MRPECLGLGLKSVFEHCTASAESTGCRVDWGSDAWLCTRSPRRERRRDSNFSDAEAVQQVRGAALRFTHLPVTANTSRAFAESRLHLVLCFLWIDPVVLLCC